ncbi:succinate-semialdehyde dehydrogenase/glutarate-semialdehyde dehydrogenase [Azospirillum lipoferum]|uniref:NAD-dependent succinate-semialdehyde dehydrogenase n=1 Tax=Azospirillum lipoferum TaxID=193 RepID=A0A5A9GC75_AZOLI|nr:MULTISPECIES: NAD-dependent succinate-semialdehyde dehydrogenase [Azospirillum]KAA0592053.1 NAD-dependent succinate-semialdehyde dehydrogenase [Azospirillum lipoferum]MCP1612067.1 succinate-semialdehyde dehydrogenase/glutarate-semialdehyde dehydrogenase [Azospirillum lipoferum]MDW5536705.1 NAD-dependent succinate-semialdehyde dehydrogenase [Azospirillum sp. NL1]
MTDLTDSTLLRERCFVAGAWIDADDGGRSPVTNPATGATITHVPRCGAEETARAIAAAEAAFPGWRAETAGRRAALLRRWFELILENREDLALLMTLEQGKPLAEARGEIDYAASYVEWFAEEAKRLYGDVIPSPLPDRRIVVVKEPVGVCAAITPWNFPAAMITRKAAPALAAGCTMIVKPAEQTPLSALALAALAERAGIPPGVFSVVTGSARQIGAVLTASTAVRKLTFTGSTEVGRLLIGQCAGTVKRLSMELGGNAPFIVFDDADLDAAVAGALASKYRNAGQTCVCSNRFLVQDGIYDRFAARLSEAVAAMTVGNGLEDGVQQGPLIDAAALAKVEDLVADATRSGATVAVGGRRHALGGTWFEPTVLTGVTASMRVAVEEIFGPVAPLIRFTDEAEAVRLANDSDYGLAAYLFTRDHARVWRVGEALEYGMVGINTGLISTAVAPFGGVKQSGFGREGSRYGIEDYVEIKYLCMGGL